MNKLFALAGAAVLFGTGIVGCSNTAEGAKEDTKVAGDKVAEAGDKAVVGTEKAAAATEKGVADAANATAKAAADAGKTVEKGAAEAGAAVKDAGKTVEKGVADAGTAVKEGTKNAADATTLTPKVKTALLNNDKLYPKDNIKFSDINVDTADNVVHLKGTVANNDMKKLAGKVAEQAVKDASATNKVSNELTVAAH